MTNVVGAAGQPPGSSPGPNATQRSALVAAKNSKRLCVVVKFSSPNLTRTSTSIVVSPPKNGEKSGLWHVTVSRSTYSPTRRHNLARRKTHDQRLVHEIDAVHDVQPDRPMLARYQQRHGGPTSSPTSRQCRSPSHRLPSLKDNEPAALGVECHCGVGACHRRRAVCLVRPSYANPCPSLAYRTAAVPWRPPQISSSSPARPPNMKILACGTATTPVALCPQRGATGMPRSTPLHVSDGTSSTCTSRSCSAAFQPPMMQRRLPRAQAVCEERRAGGALRVRLRPHHTLLRAVELTEVEDVQLVEVLPRVAVAAVATEYVERVRWPSADAARPRQARRRWRYAHLGDSSS